MRTKYFSMITILMIDDNVELCEKVKFCLLDNDKFDFEYHTNLHEGMEALIRAQGSVDALVLGGAGLFKPGDPTKRDLHVIRGIKLTRQRFPHLPILVFTSFPDKNKELLTVFDEQFPVIDKANNGKDRLLAEIERRVTEEATYLVKRRYRRVLDIFDKGYLSEDAKTLYPGLIDILTHLHHDDLHEISIVRRNGIFAQLRKIQEAIHKQISNDYPNILPPEISSFNKQINHLAGNMVVDRDKGSCTYTSKIYMSSSLRSLCRLLRTNSSEEVHFMDKNQQSSLYALKASIYALLEFILWYRDGIESGVFIGNITDGYLHLPRSLTANACVMHT